MNPRNTAIIIAYCIASLFNISACGQDVKSQEPKTLVTLLTAETYKFYPTIITARRGDAAPLTKMPVGRKNESEVTVSRYTVDYGASYLIAITSKSGVFSFAGHNHAVIATKWSANVDMIRNELGHSSVTVTAEATGLVIDSPEARQKAGLGPGPGAGEVPAIQKRMLSAEVLDVAHYPVIKFTSTAVEADGSNHLRVSGDFDLHGRRHRVVFPLLYRDNGAWIVFDGEFMIRQTDYGLRPESVAGGTIKVKDAVVIRTHIVLTSH